MQHQTEAKSDPQRILDDASSILGDGSEESELFLVAPRGKHLLNLTAVPN